MINFDYSKDRLPRTWKYVYDGIRYSAIVICPKCKMKLSLLRHTISNDGTVSPSLVCLGCDFHDFIKLDNWSLKDK